MKMSREPLRFTTAEEWRAGLEANHAGEEDAWLLISKKHAKTPSVTLQQAMQEAICSAGSTVACSRSTRNDAPCASPLGGRRATGRNATTDGPRSSSRKGRMTPAGLAKIEEAKRNGRWGKAD
jgi:uncharacterized protein YdeI (YjbR/CyaY-like superfamily)